MQCVDYDYEHDHQPSPSYGLAGEHDWARSTMKSAYELAMERLEKNRPGLTLTQEQKKELAEVDSTYKAKTAEKELLLRGEIEKAQEADNFEEVEKLEKQLASEIRRLQEDCEAKKEKLRGSFAK